MIDAVIETVLSVEKPAREGPSGHRFLLWVIRHRSWPLGGDIQHVDLTGGYCWRILSLYLSVL
jgi:hypothetical protein